MCVGGCQGRFPKGCDGCCCREDLCSVWRLSYQPGNSNHWSSQDQSSGKSFRFRCDLILNLFVSFSSKIKILGLREPKTAKLLGEIWVAMTTAPTRGQFYWLEGRRERRGCPLTAAKQYSQEKNKPRTCDSLFLPQTSRSLGKVLWWTLRSRWAAGS